ncbi:SIS domain-containing protein [Amycolatopsis taiwanensis]|uniref:SIS domain-containing protein n=1 Tax=Amycolatopsis taiwanensis TaxID=342230 RepID=A0A9W6R3J5_9PSEU|nr:SIS domain-containing protein [Amycolatopsis taiwanensis]GLY68861.1 SIS domain-containing protein [Amycolatopsis taiwanensis]
MREHVRELLDKLDTQVAELGRAAELVLDAVEAGGIVYAAGAGHSLAMVCETFYRAGGLAPVRPLWDAALLPLAGARRSSVAEREPGHGRDLVARANPAPPDVMVVFSTSGRNPYPVEVAQEALVRGVPVIAVTSLPASAAATDRSGTRLADHATVVLDTGVPPGDVIHPPQAPRTAAVSTILGAYLWASLLAELDRLATARKVTLPFWVSSNVPGGDEHNTALLARYAERIPEL